MMGTVALCAVALASGCSSSPAPDAAGTDPAAHPSSPAAPPPGFGDTALWSIPFLSQPHVVEDGFVGVVDSSDASGSHRVQVLDDTGTPRFGVDVPADRDEFAVTSTHNRELLITEDIDDPGTGAPATMTARDTRTGDLVWGPVSTAGCLTGSGLLIDADCSQTAKPAAVAAISATDGHRTDLTGAISESGGYAITVDGDTARIVTADTGNTAWSTDTLAPPPQRSPGPPDSSPPPAMQWSWHGRSRPVPNRSRRSIDSPMPSSDGSAVAAVRWW